MKKIESFKRVWEICKPYHWHLIGVLGFLLVINVVNVVSPVIFGSMVTAITKGDMRLFIITVCMFAGFNLARTGISYSKESFENRNLDYELSRHLTRISMEKFFSISMGQHHIGHTVIKKNVMARGEAAVAGIINMGIYQLIPTLLSILMPLALLLVKVPLVGIFVLVVIVCFTTYTIKYNSSFIPKLSELDSFSNVVSKKQGEIINNADVVFVNAQEEKVQKEFDEENEKQGLRGKPIWLSYLRWFTGGQCFILFSQIVCLAIIGYLVYYKKITPGSFVTIFLWMGSALGTLNGISQMQRTLARNLAPLEKYFRFLDYEPDIVMPEKPIPIEYLRGRIEFRHVSFAYRLRTDGDTLNDAVKTDVQASSPESSEIPAVQDVSFILDEGKRYAFVGKSGSGKSTLVGLILRSFDPQSGHVLVDGVDIRMLNYRELRRNVGLVPQDVSLFDGTMRYNITFGMNGSAEKITDEELDHVAKLSRVSEFSNKLEKGWNTEIGERGIKLSGGQRQRVGIARALIKNPRILIFDEATSSLDTENEARIRESIQEASVGKTTIIIAHRLATVRDADKIFVFNEGKLVGQGTHEELFRENEYYQRLVNNQIIMA